MTETFELLMNGLAITLQPNNLLLILGAGVLGIIAGALPGLGCTSGCALLLPLTFNMEPTTAIITLAALYYGTMFGGGITAILINIPGDSPAIMTAIDGYPLAQKGYPSKALFTCFISSGIGGLIGALLITFLGTTMSLIGLYFGPPELAALIIVAMTSIGWILGDKPVNGLVATMLGLLLATVGMDTMFAYERLTFGINSLVSGISFIPVAIGMFGFAQVISIMRQGIDKQEAVYQGKLKYKGMLPTKEEWKRMVMPISLGSTLGFFIGLLPGAGATSATFIAYILGRSVSPYKEDYGTGCVDGIANVEAANNAASMGSFVPLLSLGIPGSSTSAVILGGLMMWGVRPGPNLMTDEPEFCWSLIASMFTGDIILLILCIAMIPVLVSILKIKNTYLVPAVITLCIMGSYCVNNSITDIVVMFISGYLGYMFQESDIPVAPLCLGMVLGPMLEYRFRQTFILGEGSMKLLVTHPLSLGLLIFGALFVIVPIIVKKVKKHKMKAMSA